MQGISPEDLKTLTVLNLPWMTKKQVKQIKLVEQQEFSDMENAITWLEEATRNITSETLTTPKSSRVTRHPAANEQSLRIQAQNQNKNVNESLPE